jgi:hypothetical protein
VDRDHRVADQALRTTCEEEESVLCEPALVGAAPNAPGISLGDERPEVRPDALVVRMELEPKPLESGDVGEPTGSIRRSVVPATGM